MRRIASSVSLALLGAALVVPALAQPALAAAPNVEVTYYLADNDNDDGQYGLYAKTETDGGYGTHAVEAESLDTDVFSLATSADGTRVIYVRDNYDTGVEQVVVRDINDTHAQVLESTTFNPAAPVFAIEPQLSPDGRSAVWTRIVVGTTVTRTLRKASVASPAPTTLATDLAWGFFTDNTHVLAETAAGAPKVLPFAGGTRADAPTYPVGGYDFAFSRDSAKVAWAQDTDTTTVLKVASYSVTNGVPTFGTAMDLATTDANFAPGFNTDGTKIRFIKDAGSGGNIYEVPSDGSAAATGGMSTTSDEEDLATGNNDGVGPGAPTVLPSLLDGTSVVIKFSWPADADVASVRVWDSPTAPSSGTVADWPATSIRWSGVVPGTTYTLGVEAVDRGGNRSVMVPFTFTAQKAPAPNVSDPTSTGYTKAPFVVTFAPSAPANAQFFVDYVPNGSSTWAHWVTGATGRARWFGAGAATKVAATTSTPGKSYTFKAQVRDAYGNTTAWVNSARAVVPYDQTKATLYGGSNVYTSSAYLGSYRRLAKTTDYAKVTLVGNRLQVVGWKCTTCGAFAIYDGSTLVATVDTYASGTKVRQVLYTRTYSSIGTHTFTIRPKATAKRPYVMLDGFAMRT